MTEELKPCPFCGSQHAHYNNDTGSDDGGFWEWIGCDDCGAKMEGRDCVAAWNRRAAPAPAAPTPTVKMPESADEAVLMTLLGHRWLVEHAPERLTKEGREGLQVAPTPPDKMLFDRATSDQIAAVMLQSGTPEQQAEALRYAGITPTPNTDYYIEDGDPVRKGFWK